LQRTCCIRQALRRERAEQPLSKVANAGSLQRTHGLPQAHTRRRAQPLSSAAVERGVTAFPHAPYRSLTEPGLLAVGGMSLSGSRKRIGGHGIGAFLWRPEQSDAGSRNLCKDGNLTNLVVTAAATRLWGLWGTGT
jgi:hypothetical protein